MCQWGANKNKCAGYRIGLSPRSDVPLNPQTTFLQIPKSHNREGTRYMWSETVDNGQQETILFQIRKSTTTDCGVALSGLITIAVMSLILGLNWKEDL